MLPRVSYLVRQELHDHICGSGSPDGIAFPKIANRRTSLVSADENRPKVVFRIKD